MQGTPLPVVLLSVLLFVSWACAAGYYTAGVVEHAPYSVPGQVSREQAVAVMNRNLDVYEAHLQAAKQSGVQIIVFPEDGLFGDDKCTREEILPYLEYIPNQAGSVLCDAPPASVPSSLRGLGVEEQPILRRVSCLARKYGMTIVLDMGDIQPCHAQTDPRCPADGRYQYNTQVAFGDQGEFLNKYHKSHLYYEPQYNRAIPSDPATFVSSFGVKFGMMVCFDMMFGHPSLNYADSLDVFDLVYSTWWINTPPDFSATQIQQAWSRTMNMNLLAAGNGVSWQYSGSGIYSRGSVLQQHYNPTYEPADYLLISKVPIYHSKLASREEAPLDERWMHPQRVPIPLPYDVVSPKEGAVHCAQNSTFPPMAWKANEVVWDEDGTYTYPYGTLDIATPFNATWGMANQSHSATAEDLTCTVHFDVARSQPYLQEEEYYTVLAWNGWYDGHMDYYHENFCAFFRCRSASSQSCLESLIFAGTLFDRFQLEGTYRSQATMYGLTATDELRLIQETDKIHVGGDTPSNGQERVKRWIQSSSEFNTILLNASLLGRVFVDRNQ